MVLAPRRRALHIVLAIGAFVACGLAVLVAELGLRIHAPDYLTTTRGLHVFSGTYGWAARKASTATLAGQQLTVNERGYRGRSLRLPRDRDLTRVVVLGDSVAFGLGVSDNQTFCSLIDSHANGIEVANLAVQGYGPDQELLTLEHEGLRLEPDVVVLAHCMANDLAESMLAVSLYDGRMPKPRFTLVGGHLNLDASSLARPRVARVFQAINDHSYLFNRLAALAPKESQWPDRHWHERYADVMQDSSQALRVNVALVRRMQERCRERGITLLVAMFPDRLSYRQMPPITEDFVAAVRSDGIPVFDLSEAFRARGLRLKDFALDGTGHLSAAGHSIVSAELEREILRRRPPSNAQRADTAGPGREVVSTVLAARGSREAFN
jgi:hypothetical protein